MTNSVYIHIPFCNNICSYCDFCKFYYNQEWVDKYLDSLDNEINLNFKSEKLKTLYIGGGTPSSLNISELNKLFTIINKFNFYDEYEFTIECNVEDITIKKLELLKKNRVNRLSIGVESFDKDNLKFLGRNYNADIISKIRLAKEYFENINIDLIYALPNESLKTLEKDLDIFLSLDLPHVSCYSLIIEEHTKISNIKEIDEEFDYEMYKLICDKLKKYNHYEVSNYALNGYESKHNLVYWNNEEYYGFGVSASGYENNIRYTNYKNITKYNEKIYNKYEEKLVKEDSIKYELILKLRLNKGINIEDFNNKYKLNLLELYNIKDLIKENKLFLENNYLKVSKDYVYLLNEILISFV